MILNVWQPGRSWRPIVEEQLAELQNSNPGSVAPAAAASAAPSAPAADGPSLSLLDMLDGYVPKSIIQPFAENTVLTVAVLAILVGAAMRSVKTAASETAVAEAMATFERLAIACFQILVTILAWLIELAPLADDDTRTLAFEAGRKYGMRVNTISAGPLASRAAKAIGTIEKMVDYYRENAALPDLRPREWAAVVPLCAAALLMGVAPTLFLRPMEPSVQRVVERIQSSQPVRVENRAPDAGRRPARTKDHGAIAIAAARSRR